MVVVVVMMMTEEEEEEEGKARARDANPPSVPSMRGKLPPPYCTTTTTTITTTQSTVRVTRVIHFFLSPPVFAGSSLAAGFYRMTPDGTR